MNVYSKIPIKTTALQNCLSEYGWTHYRLAKKIGVSLITVQRIFQEKSATPKTLNAICKALGKTEDQFIDAERLLIGQPLDEAEKVLLRNLIVNAFGNNEIGESITGVSMEYPAIWSICKKLEIED